jgi:hypothetical protein
MTKSQKRLIVAEIAIPNTIAVMTRNTKVTRAISAIINPMSFTN